MYELHVTENHLRVSQNELWQV